jgi:anti-sigma factor RsiW
MEQLPCNRLDDYMLGWLSPDEVAEFEHHLTDCPACCRELALQQSIDGLLPGCGGPMDAIPSGLVERTRYRVRAQRRRKVVRWAFSLTVAAAMLLLLFIGRFAFWPASGPGNRDVAVSQNAAVTLDNAASNSPISALENPKASTRVALADPSSGIVLECKTSDPRINIVWIYPTVKPNTMPGEPPNE